MEYLVLEVDWMLEQKQFREQIQNMIGLARKNGKVLVLPVEPSLEVMVLSLSHVNCEGCDAICCKISPPNEAVSLTPSEYEYLAEKYGEQGMKRVEIGGEIAMPCRFLEKSRCSIYPERPLACIVFPVQPGGSIGYQRTPAMSLAPYCPQARKIAKAVYMTYWRIKQKVWSIGLEEANRLLMS